MEPPFFYVRERSWPAAHHWDYLRDRSDHALCGHGYEDPITLGEIPRPKAVCRRCQALLPIYEAKWWREQAEAAVKEADANRAQSVELAEQAELHHRAADRAAEERDALQAKYDALVVHADNQRQKLRELQEARRRAKLQKGSAAAHQSPRVSPRITAPVKKKRSRQPPPIRVVRGGLPGLGKR
ncbi:hypothetical protein [Mycolicibacterium monacense]|uniref:hypothetical protein n=1 Tax=Mycolicibacterium monacense TaxID=85693 RepID=UPI001041CE46|nr:hypothetical protein [Mycolicibacterium monacense]